MRIKLHRLLTEKMILKTKIILNRRVTIIDLIKMRKCNNKINCNWPINKCLNNK